MEIIPSFLETFDLRVDRVGVPLILSLYTYFCNSEFQEQFLQSLIKYVILKFNSSFFLKKIRSLSPALTHIPIGDWTRDSLLPFLETCVTHPTFHPWDHPRFSYLPYLEVEFKSPIIALTIKAKVNGESKKIVRSLDSFYILYTGT